MYVLICIIMALIICLYQEVHYVLIQEYIFNIVWTYTYSIIFLLKQNTDTKRYKYKQKTYSKNIQSAKSIYTEGFFIPRHPNKLSLDPLLGYQREEHLYFQNSRFLVDTKRCVCSNKSCVRSFAGCADLKLAGLCWVLCRKFSDKAMTIFCGQSVISRVYTSHFGNGSDRLEPWQRY